MGSGCTQGGGLASNVSPLADLLDQAERATPGARIELRDRIAGYGTEALPALTSWLATDRLGYFSARVIAQIAKSHRQRALHALREGREHAPAGVLRQIDDVLLQLDPPRRNQSRTRISRDPRTWPNRRLGHPYSEVEAYRVLNTSHHNNPRDDSYMLGEHRAAAFFEPWKRRIEVMQPGDIVFLYRNRAGVVGVGQVVGPVRKRPYQGNPEHPDEEFYRDLHPFQHVVPPASAGEIKDVTGRTYTFRGTLFTMGVADGERLLTHLTGGSDS
jgi:hypothetical protein